MQCETESVQPPYTGQPPPPPPVITTPPGEAEVPGVMVINQMGSTPVNYVCKSCNSNIVTRTERKPTMMTHFYAALMCRFGCWPCCIAPYYMGSCNNADHYCPNCNAYIGSYLQ